LVTELEAKDDLISEQRATVERLRQNQEQLRDIDKSLLQAREQNANYEKMIADLKQQLLNKDKEAQKWTETSKSLRQDFMNQARDEKSEFKRVHQESDDLLAKLKALKADMERNRTGTREVRSEFSGIISQKLEYFASVSASLDKMLETVK
jgi:chromosome segregation ATPase